MRFGFVHRLMTDALAALGVIALVASGQFARPVAISVMVFLVLSVLLKETWRQRLSRGHLDTALVVLLVTTQVGRGLFTSVTILDLLIEFAVALQLIRVATRRGAAHDQQIIMLALLHLIAGTVVGGGLAYGFCFVGLLVVTPGALVLSHLRREVEGNYRQGARDRTGLPVDVPRILRSKRVVGQGFIAVTCLLSVPILLFTVILFVVFPRVGLSLLLLNRPKGGRVVGFSGHVNLGQIGTLRTDPTIALRVTYPDLGSDPPMRKMMHLRGTALDHYDGRSWSQSESGLRTVGTGDYAVPVRRPNFRAAVVTQTIQLELEPIDPPVLFITPQTASLRALSSGNTSVTTVTVLTGPEGEYRYQVGHDHGLRYELNVAKDQRTPFGSLRRRDRSRYLQLPGDLPPRVRELALSWARSASSPRDVAAAIRKHLQTEYRYDLASPSGADDQPLDHFLFESKRGHCEYFSTAMAVMLRVVGVPSRNVTGFIGGTYNRYGNFYAVRQGDAHSWVEAYLDAEGWLTYDPTPPGAATPHSDIDGALASVRDFLEAISQRWNHHVVGYDLRQQVSLLERFNRHRPRGKWLAPGRTRKLALAAGICLLCFGGAWYYQRYRRRKVKTKSKAGPQAASSIVATQLYLKLEKAMVTQGVSRPRAVPPMRHAVELIDADHPLGNEILDVTEAYVAGRYGSRRLEAPDIVKLDAAIRRIRNYAQPS